MKTPATLTVSLGEARASATGELVRTAFGDLHVVVRGAGPALVLVHGVTDSSSTWHAVQAGLAGEARVLAIDLPGHGLSDIPKKPLSIAEMGSAVVEVLRVMDVRGAVVCGNSLGGGVVIAVAQQAPERVRALVPLCSLGAPFRMPFDLGLLRFRSIARTIPWIGARPRLRRFMMRSAYHRGFVPSDEDLDRYFAGWRVRGRARYVAALVRSVDVAEPHGWLASLAVPTHVVHGDEDRLIPPFVARELAARIPGARLTIMPRTGHEPHVERPIETIALLRGELRGIAGA